MITQLESTIEYLIFDQQFTDKPQATQSLLLFKTLGSFDTLLLSNWNLNLGIISVLARVQVQIKVHGLVCTFYY